MSHKNYVEAFPICICIVFEWVWLNGHGNESNEDFMLHHPGGMGGGGNTVPVMYDLCLRDPSVQCICC